MKQTAVEWYGFQIGILISKFFNNEISKSEVHFKRLEIEEQAKEMEKEQKIEFAFDFYYDFSNQSGVPFNLISENRTNAEKYYEQKFKSE